MSVLSREVPQGTEKADKIIAGRSFLDVGVLVGIPIVVGIFLMYFDIITGLQFLPILAGIILANAIIFRIFPENESVLLWLRGLKNYIETPKVMTERKMSGSVAADEELSYTPEINNSSDEKAEGDEEKETITREDAVPKLWETDETVTDLVGVHNVFKGGVILRSDGCLVAAVEVIGKDISLADRDQTGKIVRQYAQHMNNIDFSPKTYITDDEFDLEGYIDNLKDRFKDQDIQERPILRELNKSYIGSVRSRGEEMGVKKRRTFELIVVDPTQDSESLEDTPLSKYVSPDSPVGKLLKMESEDENREFRRALNEMESRVASLVSGLQGIDGVEVRRVDSTELVEIVSQHFKQGKVSDSTWTPQENTLQEANNETAIPDLRAMQER